MITTIVVWVGIAFVALIMMGAAMAALYKRSSKELAFVRTGLGGEKVILDGGAIKLPIFQDMLHS